MLLQRFLSKRLAHVLAGCLPLLACHAAFAQTTLSGPMMVGTYSYSGDVIIENVTMLPNPGAPALRTLTIQAYGGTITCSGSGSLGAWAIDGSGLDGVNGVPGDSWTITPPTNGTSADAAWNVVLETWPNPLSPTLPIMDINVGGSIDCSGGNGGNGAYGDSEHVSNCYFSGPAQNASSPGKPTAGGSITLRASGNIQISSSVLAMGGKGGDGADGGSGITTPAGASTAGIGGAKGGAIVLEQTRYAPRDSAISLYLNWFVAGHVNASGGASGRGGHGAYGNGSVTPGSNAGKGGAGGTVTITGRNLYLTSTIEGVPVTVDVSGGWGAQGGDGSSAAGSGCFEMPFCTFHIPIAAHIASAGGQGGSGGDAGSITAKLANDASFNQATGFRAVGGLGFMAGRSGNGGVDAHVTCESGAPCSEFTLLSGQPSPAPGHGGAGGGIELSAATINMGVLGFYSSFLTAMGGDGAQGVIAANPGHYCCEFVLTCAPGYTGGKGGNGGPGGKITLWYTTLNAPTNPFYICSGTPGNGGDGSFGVPTGAGGPGGSWGLSGALYKNGVLQPSLCGISPPVNGNPGPGLPICVIGG